jgi:hypothetical protein
MGNMKKLSMATVGAAVIALGTISAGQAQPITSFTSRTNWNTAVSGSSTFLEDFESFTADTPFRITPVDVGEFTLLQVGANPNFRNLIEVPPFQFDDNNGTKHASMFTNFGATTVDMTFDTPVFAWGADFFGADETTGERLNLDLVLDMGGVFVTIPVTTNNGFFGFVTNPAEQIRQLTFVSRTNNPGTGGEGFGLDNVAGAQSQAVPEPTSMLGVLVFAALGTGSVLKRKQQQKA